MGVGLGGPHRVRVGEGLGEPLQLEGHLRMPSQDVAKAFVGEFDLSSMFISEALQASLPQ